METKKLLYYRELDFILRPPLATVKTKYYMGNRYTVSVSSSGCPLIGITQGSPCTQQSANSCFNITFSLRKFPTKKLICNKSEMEDLCPHSNKLLCFGSESGNGNDNQLRLNACMLSPTPLKFSQCRQKIFRVLTTWIMIISFPLFILGSTPPQYLCCQEGY